MTASHNTEVPFEEILPDGTIRRGTLQLTGAWPTDKQTQMELELLRNIASAVESFQLSSKYFAGDFSACYQALQEWRAWKKWVLPHGN